MLCVQPRVREPAARVHRDLASQCQGGRARRFAEHRAEFGAIVRIEIAGSTRRVRTASELALRISFQVAGGTSVMRGKARWTVRMRSGGAAEPSTKSNRPPRHGLPGNVSTRRPDHPAPAFQGNAYVAREGAQATRSASIAHLRYPAAGLSHAIVSSGEEPVLPRAPPTRQFLEGHRFLEPPVHRLERNSDLAERCVRPSRVQHRRHDVLARARRGGEPFQRGIHRVVVPPRP